MNQSELEKILFMDLETVANVYKYDALPATEKELWNKKWQYNPDISPEKQYDKAGIYAEFGKVICIGFGFYKNGKFQVASFSSDNEKEVLQKFSELLQEFFNTTSHLLCAHNGKEFDFPFLCRRLLINNMPLPRMLQIQGKKPWEVKHIDTMELWKFGDIKNFSSLNLLAHVLGLPSPKDDMDGSMVGKTYFEEKDLPRIAKYCMKDVVTMARVYRRFSGSGNLADDDVIFV